MSLKASSCSSKGALITLALSLSIFFKNAIASLMDRLVKSAISSPFILQLSTS